MANNSERIKWTSPAGLAVFPRLGTPSTKFKPNGEYHCDLKITDPKVAAEVKAQLDGFFADNLAEQKRLNRGKTVRAAVHLPYRMELDDQDNETGALIVKSKLDARITPKNGEPFDQRPTLFDAKGKPVQHPEALNIGSGSEIKLGCEVNGWYVPSQGAGVSLRLRAVQIINLVEYTGPGAEAYGFGEEDGGFSYEDDVATTGDGSSSGAEDDGSGDF